MSRWTTTFEVHGFHAQLKRVIESADSISGDDPSILSYMDEIGRLRKALAYIKQAVHGVDPELLPLMYWDPVRDYLSNAADQLNAFISTKALGHLQQANQFIDSVLVQLRPQLLAKGRLGPALQTAAKSYATSLEEASAALVARNKEALAQLESDQQKASQLLSVVRTSAAAVTAAHDELLVDTAERDATRTTLAKFIDEITIFHRRLASGSGDGPSIKEEVAAAREAAVAGKEAIESLLATVSPVTTNLSAFEAKVLGAVSESGQRTGGIADEIDRRLHHLRSVEEQQSKRYAALNEKIESLMPGATSAGLASAYKQMKDSFAEPIHKASRLFFFSIAGILLASFVLSIESVGFWHINFQKLSDWNSIGRALAHKLPFVAPLVWLAYYASKRRSEFQRLEQEYAHKEALAKSYDNYRQQVADLGRDGDALMRDLLAKAIDAIAFNASASLDRTHGDKVPFQEVLDKVVTAVREARAPAQG